MPRTLVLGLGNDLLGDDAVGVLAARALREELRTPGLPLPSGGEGAGELVSANERWAVGTGDTCRGEGAEMCIDVVESPLSGLALLDLFIGYDRAVVIDAVKTGRHPPGAILELAPSDLGAVLAPSPHYAGLPEMLALAGQMDLDFPAEVKIFAVEVEDPYTVGGKVSAAVEDALPELIRLVKAHLLP